MKLNWGCKKMPWRLKTSDPESCSDLINIFDKSSWAQTFPLEARNTMLTKLSLWLSS